MKRIHYMLMERNVTPLTIMQKASKAKTIETKMLLYALFEMLCVALGYDKYVR
jgi:hypothetical protein